MEILFAIVKRLERKARSHIQKIQRQANDCEVPRIGNIFLDRIKSVLERTPPELAADIVGRGIILSVLVGLETELLVVQYIRFSADWLPIIGIVLSQCQFFFGWFFFYMIYFQ